MRLLVIGAGGHATVVIDAAEMAGWEIAAVVGDNPGATDILGHPVTPLDQAPDADAFIVAIGDNEVRARYFGEYAERGLRPATVVHPTAVVARSASIAPGTFVGARAVVNPLAEVGANTILNTACVIEHHVKVGAHSHVGPLCALCGASSIGESVLLGVGTVLKPGVCVGAGSTVGAGGVVVSDLAENQTWVGVPAKRLERPES